MNKEFSPEKNGEKEILELTSKKLGSLMKRDAAGTYDRISEKAAELNSKYSNCSDYKMYHVLIMSTLDENLSPLFDFPDKDSVEKFIELLEESSDLKP